MDIFDYSSERVTIRYIGINQDEVDKAMARYKSNHCFFLMVLPSNICLI